MGGEEVNDDQGATPRRSDGLASQRETETASGLTVVHESARFITYRTKDGDYIQVDKTWKCRVRNDDPVGSGTQPVSEASGRTAQERERHD